MEPQYNIKEEIFIQAIDQNFKQEAEEEPDLTSDPFFSKLLEDDSENPKPLGKDLSKTCRSFHPNGKGKKKFKFKFLLKPKWEETISMMKTNNFLAMKAAVKNRLKTNEILQKKSVDLANYTLILSKQSILMMRYSNCSKYGDSMSCPRKGICSLPIVGPE